MKRRTLLTAGAVITGAIVAALIVGRLAAPSPQALAVPPVAGGPVVRWQVDVGQVATVPELVAHPPAVAGDRLVVAGSRIGYVGLDRATGALAWRRPGGAGLSAPLVIDAHDAVLVRECLDAIGAPSGTAVIACFDRIDPTEIAIAGAGSIQAPLADADQCPASGQPWRVLADAGHLVLHRPPCTFSVALPSGDARLISTGATAPPPAPGEDCGVLDDGTRWCQHVDGGASEVELAGVRLPGLSVLAAARDGDRLAAVVRLDATLRHDVLYVADGDTPRWSWPLPEPPPGGRSTPIGVSIAAAGVFLLFDTSQVAAFAP